MKTLRATDTKSYQAARFFAVLGLALLFMLLFSMARGAYGIDAERMWAVFLQGIGIEHHAFKAQDLHVLVHLRLPRVLLASLVGGGLGIAGASLQGLFRNPLVEPGLIGVSAGSALFAVILIVFGPLIPLVAAVPIRFLLPLAAFLGGLLVTFLVYRLGSLGGKTDISLLILAGVALNALAGALIGLVIYYADDAALRNFTFWSLGDVGGANWDKFQLAFLFMVPAMALILSQYKALNALAIGEQEAFHMGIDVQRVKGILLLCSALIVGTAVAFTGTIGFVGLIVPHLIRMWQGADHRLVLGGSFLLGALLLTLSDLLARTLVAPAELPIGIITALLGAPFFIYLIMQVKRTTSC
ncbi:MAG: FecCD family ABC transporter permease [Nitritalea sp.]